jgi:hypothetical protein
MQVLYLCNEGATVKGLRVFGTPLNVANSKVSQNCAFQPAYGATGDEDPMFRAAAQIPPGGLDLLISHGPPAGVLDGGVGAPLLAEIARRERPALHVFGHQHLAYGVAFDAAVGTLFVNAASCDGLFAPLHPPVVIDVRELPRSLASQPRRQAVHISDPDMRGGSGDSAEGFRFFSASGGKLLRSPWTLEMERTPFAIASN